MSKRLYVINLWGRGGEIHFHELTKAGYEMTYNREWEFENWWEINDIELDRIKKEGFKNCGILVCGLFHNGTPLTGVFHNRDYVIFGLGFFEYF